MNDFTERLVADVWGRRLEGYPLGEADCILLADACDHDAGLPGRLLDDEGIDRLLRHRARGGDAAVVERFVGSVLAAIDAAGAGRDASHSGRTPEDPAAPDPVREAPKPPRPIVRPSPARRRHGFDRVWPALIACLALAAAVGILLAAWQRPAAPRPARAKPGAAPVRQVPSRTDSPPLSPGYMPMPEPGEQPTIPVPEPRDNGPAVAPAAPAPAPAPMSPPRKSPRPAVRGPNGRATGARSVVISEQTLNGRFEGTITVDGETRKFDTREAFEAARRELGR